MRQQLLTVTAGYREVSSGIDRYFVDGLKLDILLFGSTVDGKEAQRVSSESSIGIANTCF